MDDRKIIEARNLSCGYKGAEVLSDISFELQRGDALLVSGPNGCGKTTLLKVLAGIFFPCRGSWYYDGTEITEKYIKSNGAAFHSRVGLVFQNPEVMLFCGTVREVIAFGPEQRGMDRHTIDERLADSTAAMGIEHLLDRAPWELSGGEKKKTAIAAVICDGPETMLLDEPLAGLDEESVRNTLEVLRTLTEQGTTVIISSHEGGVTEALSPKVLALRK